MLKKNHIHLFAPPPQAIIFKKIVICKTTKLVVSASPFIFFHLSCKIENHQPTLHARQARFLYRSIMSQIARTNNIYKRSLLRFSLWPYRYKTGEQSLFIYFLILHFYVGWNFRHFLPSFGLFTHVCHQFLFLMYSRPVYTLLSKWKCARNWD